MESVKSNSHSWRCDNHLSPENSKWLAENLQGVDQIVKEIFRLIGDESSDASKAEQKRPELIAHVEEFYSMHRSVAERYDNLIGELCRNIPSPAEIQHPGISYSGSHHASPLLTPDQKLSLCKSERAGVFDDLFSSSGCGSSEISLKEGFESLLSLSTDSDSESCNSSISKDLVLPVKADGKGLHNIYVKLETELSGNAVKVQGTDQEDGDGTTNIRDAGTCEMLRRRVCEYEEELSALNNKLHLLEKDNSRLKAEKDESVVAIDSLKAQLDSALQDIQSRDINLEMEKAKVLKLRNQVVELETQIGDSYLEIGLLREESKIVREKIRGAEEELAKLKHEYCNENHQLLGEIELIHGEKAFLEAKLKSEKILVTELQEEILGYTADVSHRDQEIRKLNVALCDSKRSSTLEKTQLQCEITSLLEKESMLRASIGEFEMQIKQCENEKAEMKALHEAKVKSWQIEVKEKGEQVEALYKNMDLLKVRNDMLRAEKDGVNAKMERVRAELQSRENKIRRMEDEKVKLIEGSEREVRMRIEELEKEVERQRGVISDRGEEKREAIRQLCLSLEHYRTGYQQLRQAYKRPHAVALV